MVRNIWILVLCSLFGCVGIPAGITPVTGFDIERYKGTWYEIARLDQRFEAGLERVTAQYSSRPDGGIAVLNRGFDPVTGTWKEALGKAYFVGDTHEGRLKVSFFGPFYGSYTIIALDKTDYSYAMVCGPDSSYLWILSRDPYLKESIKNELVHKARALGFDTEKLVFIKQEI